MFLQKKDSFQNYSVEIKMSVDDSVDAFLKSLTSEKRICETDGCKIAWIPYTVTSRSNPLTDQVSGICLRCGQHYSRGLNEKELREVSQFYESLREPMTI